MMKTFVKHMAELNRINYPKSGWGSASHAVCFWSTANGIGTWLRRFSLPSATAQSNLDDGDRNKLAHSKWIETLYPRKNINKCSFKLIWGFLNCFFRMIPNERNCTTIGTSARCQNQKRVFPGNKAGQRTQKQHGAQHAFFLQNWGVGSCALHEIDVRSLVKHRARWWCQGPQFTTACCASYIYIILVAISANSINSIDPIPSF